jgi:cytochrome b subunit of formate dehydrogenase
MVDFKKLVHWLLVISVILTLLSGFGITEFRIIEQATFGLLTKPLSFMIHTYVWLFFLVLLVAHIYLSWERKKK